MKFIACIFLLIIFEKMDYTVLSSKLKISPTKTIIWGPGLKPDKITMRARYFFLQLVDTQGQNLTVSPGSGIVTAVIQGQTWNKQSCHIWTQVLDCKDGSFIIRYKLHNTCLNVILYVKVNGQDLQILPLKIIGPVYEEECYCPNTNFNNWLNTYDCPNNYAQIISDLTPFTSVDFNKIRKPLIKKYDKPNSVSLCHYIIKNNRIYRQCYGQHVGFKIFMDAILLSLARKVILPDVEFFVNLGDWPLVPKEEVDYPIFSWCGSIDTKDIVMPTYDITESSLEAMGRVMLDMLSVQGNTDTPWEKKIEKLFWRGRDACRERLDLIDISRKQPDLFNVSLTNFFFFKNEIEKYGPAQSHISFFQFFKHKYQLNIDGTVAAYRFPYLLAGDSLVLKQKSKYYEFFYNDLIPETHYVLVKRDLSDLVDKIKWAKKNDRIALNISKTARQFIRDNLLPQHVFCYYSVLLKEWSKRLTNEIKVLDNMEEVLQPQHSCKCNIDDVNLKDEL
ncbi:protein O-glucosyltransferase 2-like [Vespula squamosa]|uniref:Protein O-glucosyltransferase 2-like n=1 Tax=Vespula squamosa TaxID=30214 RepID=A0ABD2AJK7_VESSQ